MPALLAPTLPSQIIARAEDHITVLKDGHIEAEGTLSELLETCEEMQRLWSGNSDGV